MISQDEFHGRAAEASITADYAVSAARRLHTVLTSTASLKATMPRATDPRIGPGRPSVYLVNSPDSTQPLTVADHGGSPITLSDGGTTLEPGEVASMYLAGRDDDDGEWFGKVETVSQIFDGAPGEVFYAFGGIGAPSALRQVNEFNQQTNVWATKTQTVVSHAFAGGFTVGTAGYYIGCDRADAPDGRNKITRYDPDTHTARTDLPFGNVSAAQFADAAGRGFLAGWGLDPNGCREYDASGDSWTTRTDKTTACVEGRGAELLDDVYVFNGTTSGSANGNLQAYDPGTDSWASKTSAPTPHVRDFALFVAANDRAYKVCGEVPLNVEQDAVREYDPLGDSWASLGVFPVVAQQQYGAAPEGDGIVAQGSEGATATISASTREYNELTDVWTSHGAAPSSKTGMTNLAIAP